MGYEGNEFEGFGFIHISNVAGHEMFLAYYLMNLEFNLQGLPLLAVPFTVSNTNIFSIFRA
jgi:hypothetical protein